jgi:hypothetical protein
MGAALKFGYFSTAPLSKSSSQTLSIENVFDKVPDKVLDKGKLNASAKGPTSGAPLSAARAKIRSLRRIGQRDFRCNLNHPASAAMARPAKVKVPGSGTAGVTSPQLNPMRNSSTTVFPGCRPALALPR